MREQEPTVAGALARGVLEAVGGDPVAHPLGADELPFDGRVLVEEAAPLLVGGDVLGLGVGALVHGDADRAHRVLGALDVVEGDDPEPAAFDEVVQGAAVPLGGRPLADRVVGDVVERLDADVVGEHRAGVVLEACGLLAQGELLRQRGAEAARVDEVLGPEHLAVLAGDGDAVVVEVEIGGEPVLPGRAAVLGGDVEVVLVAVLAEEVAGVGEDLGDDEHRRLLRVGLAALLVLDEPEGLLLAVVRADVVGDRLGAEQMAELGDVEARLENVQPLDELRRHRLPHREPGVLTGVDEDHLGALAGQDRPGDRAGQARSQDEDVAVLDVVGLLGLARGHDLAGHMRHPLFGRCLSRVCRGPAGVHAALRRTTMAELKPPLPRARTRAQLTSAWRARPVTRPRR